jgi:hypothetical protein
MLHRSLKKRKQERKKTNVSAVCVRFLGHSNLRALQQRTVFFTELTYARAPRMCVSTRLQSTLIGCGWLRRAGLRLYPPLINSSSLSSHCRPKAARSHNDVAIVIFGAPAPSHSQSLHHFCAAISAFALLPCVAQPKVFALPGPFKPLRASVVLRLAMWLHVGLYAFLPVVALPLFLTVAVFVAFLSLTGVASLSTGVTRAFFFGCSELANGQASPMGTRL